MQVFETDIAGVLVIEPERIADTRGFFSETYRADRYATLGLSNPFMQDNWSRSSRGVLRGLHLQNPNEQGKLLSVVRGAIFDVAVDVRVGSPTYGRHVAVILSEENGRQFFVPCGFAHGFQVLSEIADCIYKCDGIYSPKDEIVIRWNDPALAIDWPVKNPILSPRDASAPVLAEAKRLPQFAR